MKNEHVVWWIGFALFALGVCCLLGQLAAWDYASTSQHLSEWSGIAPTILARFFSAKTYYVLRVLVWIGVPLVLVIIAWLVHYRWAIRVSMCRGGAEVGLLVRKSLHFANTYERNTYFFSLAGICTVWTAAAAWFPLHIDEAFSYLFLVDRGLLVTLTFYPGPNNHVGYLLLCALVRGFTESPGWVMRLPIVLISLCFAHYYYTVVRRICTHRTGLYALWIFALSPAGLFYATHGRGYLLQTLCVWVLLVHAWQYLHYKKLRWLHASLTVWALVWGTYTVPTFVYPAAAIFLFFSGYTYRQRRYDAFKKLLLLYMLGVFFVGILYAPLLLLSGWSALLENSWVKPLGRAEWWAQLPDYLLDCLQFPFGEGGSLFVLSAIVVGVWGIYRAPSRSRYAFYFATATLFIFPLFALSLQKVLPPQRTWVYLVSFLSLYAAVGWVSVEPYIPSRQLRAYLGIFLCAVGGFLGLWSTFHTWNDPANIYRQVHRASVYLYQRQAQHVFIRKDMYNIFLRMEYRKHRQAIRIETSADSLRTHPYDFFILPLTADMPASKEPYREVLRDDYVVIWERLPSAPLYAP